MFFFSYFGQLHSNIALFHAYFGFKLILLKFCEILTQIKLQLMGLPPLVMVKGLSSNLSYRYSLYNPIVNLNHIYRSPCPNPQNYIDLTWTQAHRHKFSSQTGTLNSNFEAEVGNQIHETDIPLGNLEMIVSVLFSSVEGSGHALSATRSVLRNGSSLALRNISNIPFEKTLSTTACRGSQSSQSTPGIPALKLWGPWQMVWTPWLSVVCLAWSSGWG